MYLDLFDDLKLNKKLIKLVGFEVAAYWAELQSILKQVVKKHTADELGFFSLDRDYVQRETTLSTKKQLQCEEKLISLGVLAKDSECPNRLAISVSTMVELITDEDTKKLRKSTAVSKEEEKAAKLAGLKAGMQKCIQEEDVDLKAAYCLWVDSMIDAKNCRFTKAVIQLFEKTINEFTADKQLKLKIIETCTISSYRDANWAIEKLPANVVAKNGQTTSQKVGTSVANNIIF